MIYTSITRVFPVNEWRDQEAQRLATAILQPVALRPMSLMDLFQLSVAQGALTVEFRSIWGYGEFVKRTEEALQGGNLVGAVGLLQVCPVSFSPQTLAAIQAILAANTLRVVDVAAAERREAAPVTVTTDDVIAALAAAGYQWDGLFWQYVSEKPV